MDFAYIISHYSKRKDIEELQANPYVQMFAELPKLDIWEVIQNTRPVQRQFAIMSQKIMEANLDELKEEIPQSR
jgi:hypothetical protein